MQDLKSKVHIFVVVMGILDFVHQSWMPLTDLDEVENESAGSSQ
jgi:hypothetical protein